MIQITLHTFMGMEKIFGGKKSQVIGLPHNSSVDNMLQELGDLFGEDFVQHVMTQQKTLRKNIVVMVNGVNIFAKEGFDTRLYDGDRVLFFPPVAGG